MFKNRASAGMELASKLEEALSDPVVLALPRGGLPLAVEIAQKIDAPLDLVLIRKIGHPEHPEFAIGAIAEDNPPLLDPTYTDRIEPEWLKQKVSDLQLENQRRREHYLKHRERIPLKNKTAIIVDDGVATGLTLLAAVDAVKKHEPQKIVAAVPVSPKDTALRIESKVDQLIALEIPEFFLGAVGAYYQEFPQVSDEEVVMYLNQMNKEER